MLALLLIIGVVGVFGDAYHVFQQSRTGGCCGTDGIPIGPFFLPPFCPSLWMLEATWNSCESGYMGVNSCITYSLCCPPENPAPRLRIAQVASESSRAAWVTADVQRKRLNFDTMELHVQNFVTDALWAVQTAAVAGERTASLAFPSLCILLTLTGGDLDPHCLLAKGRLVNVEGFKVDHKCIRDDKALGEQKFGCDPCATRIASEAPHEKHRRQNRELNEHGKVSPESCPNETACKLPNNSLLQCTLVISW